MNRYAGRLEHDEEHGVKERRLSFSPGFVKKQIVFFPGCADFSFYISALVKRLVSHDGGLVRQHNHGSKWFL